MIELKFIGTAGLLGWVNNVIDHLNGINIILFSSHKIVLITNELNY